MLGTLRRLFEYDAWANREALAALQRAGAASGRSLKLLAHVLGAQLLWLARLRGEASAVVVWPEMTILECEKGIGQLERLWRSYLGEQTPESLSAPIAYTNSRGEAFTDKAGDILMHVILHSAYHRGQIAADTRAAGSEPASTDFIHAVRKGHVE